MAALFFCLTLIGLVMFFKDNYLQFFCVSSKFENFSKVIVGSSYYKYFEGKFSPSSAPYQLPVVIPFFLSILATVSEEVSALTVKGVISVSLPSFVRG